MPVAACVHADLASVDGGMIAAVPLFLFGGGQHLLAGRCDLVALLREAGDDASAARCNAFAILLIAHAGAALFGRHLLRESGLRKAEQGGGGQDGS